MDEYKAHVFEKRCPAGVCQSLSVYTIIEDKCIGCTACARACPVKCISGSVKKPHVINQDKCIKCGACLKACAFSAVDKK
jgi:Na+-translocating ferredoxin:NAD+ oxidoreductase RNF subunit RnfB